LQSQPPLSAGILVASLNLSSDGIIVFEPVPGNNGRMIDMRIELMNDAAVKIFDTPREVAYGQLLTALWDLESDDPCFEHMRRMLDTGEPTQYEWYTDKPGKRRWFEINLHPFGENSLAASYHEITERRRYIEELEHQKAFYEELIRHSPSRKTVLRPIRNSEGEIEDFCCEYVNYGPGIDDRHRNLSPFETSLLGQRLTVALPGYKQTEVWGLCCDVAETGITKSVELSYTEDGKNTLAALTAQLLPDGRVYVSTLDVSESRKLAVELEESARLLNAVLDASPVAIAVYRAIRDEAGAIDDFRPVIANRHALEVVGQSYETFAGKTLFQRVPDKETRLPELRNVTEHRKEWTHEYYVPDTNRWVHSVTTPFGDGFISTVQDITEQKQATQKIEEGINLLNAVLDSSPVAVVVYSVIRNSEGKIQDFKPIIANKYAIEISGRTHQEFMDMTLLQRNPGMENILAELTGVVEEGHQRSYEHEIGHSGRWVHSVTTPFGDGFISTAQDITAQKHQSAQIEEQAQLFNGVLNSLQNGLSVYRIIRNESGGFEDLEYLEIARSIELDTGMKRGDMIGKRITSLFPGIQHTDHWKAYTEVATTGQSVSFETHFTLAGYDNYIVTSVTPIGKDKLASVYYIINDLKRAQRELEHTVHELQRSNEDLEQFASIASHDLQEPLRKVESFGAMLESRYADALGEHGRDLLQRMQNAATRMRNLVSGLLAFSRLSGDGDVPLSPVDLTTLISDVLADLDETIKTAGANIRIPARLPFVQGLDGQLHHLFHNLLTNALKFRRENITPEVHITWSALKPGDETHLSPLAFKESYLRIDIRDNGIGFESEFAEKIFGLFERLHGVSKYKGTGLGLSICRRVVDRHEGAIWAQSEPGKGAVFTVLLKRA
jgi:signal transduction histidine kinase